MPRLPGLIAVAALTSATTVALLGAVAARAEAPHPANATPTPESRCMPDVETTVWPDTVLLGESVDVTHTVNVICAGERMYRHIALVLDGSDSMRGDPQSDRDAAAGSIVSSLDLKDYPSTTVAVIGFADDTQLLSRLANDEASVLRAVGRAGPDSLRHPRMMPPGSRGLDDNTRLDVGIREGHHALVVGRQGLDRLFVTEAMVVLSDGRNTDGCAPVRKAASAVRADGVFVVAVCTGRDCDQRCMREVASSPRYLFDVRDPMLGWIFQDLHEHYIQNIGVRLLEVRVALPPLHGLHPGERLADTDRAGRPR
jgi:hypothetical protein